MNFLGALARGIDGFSEATGKLVAWLALFMVLLQFTIVLMRYVFGIGSIFMQEGMIYLHASLFMLAAAYTLKHNGHVRVDVFYRTASPRRKAWTNLIGTLVLLWPFCFVVVQTSLPYVLDAWAIREGSKETSGIQAVYLLKTLIPVFAVLVALQGLAIIAHSLRVIAGVEAFEEDEAEAI